MYLYIKKIIDIIAALFIFLIFLVPGLVISVIIVLDSKGGVFYKQKRITKDGNFFMIYKFRTMVSNADKMGSYSTQKNDSRITKIGSFLRKYSIDEIPQIINIILGEMSLIGPRPDVPAQIENYTATEFIERHKVLPGITGLAQSRDRHGTSNRNRIRYDIFYNKKLSLFLDIKIFFWTIKTIIKGSY